ncbi:MAG TPA: OmpA family protein [Tepidisphaeraceae bacterium]|nr:OmpA family protein [Tepidisphaeraceae bacterium]
MAKCNKCPECEECPEWIFTFADLVMLMMGFFVILWVLKPAPGKADDNPSANDDWIAVAAAVREAFGYLPDPHSKDPVDLHMLLKKMHTINPVKGPKLGSRNRVEQRSADGTDPEVQTIRDGKNTVTGGRLLFDRGQNTLSPEVQAALDQIAGQIRGHFTIVRVKGHTAADDLPENATAQQKMELSVRRAQAVVDYLAAHGVDPQVLRLEGCSTFEPVKLRAYTADSVALNRRVEVEVTATLVGQRQGKGDGEAPLPSSQPVDTH